MVEVCYYNLYGILLEFELFKIFTKMYVIVFPQFSQSYNFVSSSNFLKLHFEKENISVYTRAQP